MVWYCALLLAVGLTSALPSQKLHPLSDEYIQEINKKQSTWKAGRNFEIDEYELFKTLASGVRKPAESKRAKNIKIHDETEPVPESFDAREAWPECADIIGTIRDQSICEASWAFATVEAMSDRICIHSNATRKIMVSAQNLLTCADSTSGCSGGWPSDAWYSWEEIGIVTGGLYNRTDQGCQSYFLAPCDDHLRSCTDYSQTPYCSEECDDPNLNYTSQLTYGDYDIALYGEKQIQLEIMKNGPVVAVMVVYADFASYKSGIYQQVCTYSLVGEHAVKIIGWGIENGTKYWLAANSWNERWGENGYFRIIRGTDETYIESFDVSAGFPDFRKF